MRKSLLTIATVVALAASIASPAAAARNTPTAPYIGNAYIYSDLEGPVAYYLDSVLQHTTVDGDVALVVHQSGVGSAIVKADLNLPAGMTWIDYYDYDVEGIDGDACNTTNLVVDFSGRTATAKGFSCTDSDTDGSVEFVFWVDGAEIDNTITAADYYPVTSQYRTDSTRKYKETAWIVGHDNLGWIDLYEIL